MAMQARWEWVTLRAARVSAAPKYLPTQFHTKGQTLTGAQTCWWDATNLFYQSAQQLAGLLFFVCSPPDRVTWLICASGCVFKGCFHWPSQNHRLYRKHLADNTTGRGELWPKGSRSRAGYALFLSKILTFSGSQYCVHITFNSGYAIMRFRSRDSAWPEEHLLPSNP